MPLFKIKFGFINYRDEVRIAKCDACDVKFKQSWTVYEVKIGESWKLICNNCATVDGNGSIDVIPIEGDVARSNNENQFEQVLKCLEDAIVSVAEEEFDRLSKGDTPIYRVARVCSAFKELDKLRTDQMPDYSHQWLPLLYLTRYHPSQVNLAYSIVMNYLKRKAATGSMANKTLYMFDFGCGTLAMLFGVALAELKCRMDGHPIPQIRVDSMDASKPMTELGEKVWERFNECVQRCNKYARNDRRFPDLAAINSHIINELPSEFPRYADDRWLSALHVVYPDNCSEVKHDLNKIAKSIEPTAGVITTSDNKGGWARKISPFEDDQIIFDGETKLNFQSRLVRITNWRSKLPQHLLFDASPEQEEYIEKQLNKIIPSTQKTIKSHLYWNITWDGSSTPYALIYSLQPNKGTTTQSEHLSKNIHIGLADSLPVAPPVIDVPKKFVLDAPDRLGRTSVEYHDARAILTRGSRFMSEYDFTLNPYSGCGFGCTYCYAAFFYTSKKERDSWGDWVKVKQNAINLLAKRKSGTLDDKLIYMSTATDPYQPVERKLELTRGLLETMVERRHKVKLVVQTRSPDVTRDIDLYWQIEDNGGRVQINMTVTTDDEEVRKTFEPYCPSNSARLEAISEVQRAGIQSCITMTPLLWVEEPELFARELLSTKINRFIAYPFDFQRSKFIANTWLDAIKLMINKLDCHPDEFLQQYMGHYQHAFQILSERLPSLGEGKDGFKPPF